MGEGQVVGWAGGSGEGSVWPQGRIRKEKEEEMVTKTQRQSCRDLVRAREGQGLRDKRK